MHLCIISPHLDDAVLSCGIRMQRVIAGGGRVSVVNLFHVGTNGDNRRREEDAALDLLGAEALYLHELDAPDRDARYKTDAEIFQGDFAHVPEHFITHITARLAECLRDLAPDAVMFPLAAGTHIDHRIAYAAGRRLAAGAPTLAQSYYEDRPYVLWPGMLQARMNEIGCDAGLAPVTAEEMAASHADYYFVSGAGKFPRSLSPALLSPPAVTHLTGAADELLASEGEITRLYDSLACYESQMPHIYPDRQRFLQDSYAHEMARTGRPVYAERSWRLAPA